MRFNKQELVALASQTSIKFDREGVLVLKEKQDGFFRRSEGCSVRWFRLRGNLLFYLKGPEPWYEPMGVIVLGQHQVNVQPQDENGQWPFQIGWENGVSYRMATFHESERTMWLKAIQMASYDTIKAQVADLKERLTKIRPVLDIASYRLQKGIVIDMNEVPLCELALSCDNLLCDTHGRPPSPLIVVFVKFKGLCVRYGSTEIVETCSNPSFSKTVVFRASDGLTDDAHVRVVVYDVRERVSETAVPMGFTALQLSTIQEAQRLRVALQTRDNKTVGFVTINGWSLEPSYIGTSPSHTSDKNSIEIPQKILCHRRSQSLPPRLGLKLQFPVISSLLKQSLANSYQVTYRFHSGLGGDITVHEIMAEPTLCLAMPMQLLDIYILREKELLEELLSVGEMCSQWQSRQLDLISIHVSLLKHYCHSKLCMQQVDSAHFKPSSRKDEASLEFVPINLHLQRMWVHNDTLNKTGFHDVITVGAFAAHTHKAERTGGLISLVQKVKDVNSTKAELNSVTNKIQAEYENVLAVRRLKDEVSHDLDKVLMLLLAKQAAAVAPVLEGVRKKIKSFLALFDPTAIEESLSFIGWPENNYTDNNETQATSTIVRLTELYSMFDTMSSDCDTFDASSSSSSKETSPTVDFPSLSSSVPNIFANNHKELKTELHFYNNYFKSEKKERSNLNLSFRSVRSPAKPRLTDTASLSFDNNKVRHGSLRDDFKSSASLEQVSYRSLMSSIGGNDKKKGCDRRDSSSLPPSQLDPGARDMHLSYLTNISSNVDEALAAVARGAAEATQCLNAIRNLGSETHLSYLTNISSNVDEALAAVATGAAETARSLNDKAPLEEKIEQLKGYMESLKWSSGEAARWLRISHAALRLRSEAPGWAQERAALQTRRDTCFSQALTSVTTGLLCWLSSAPRDVVVKVLSSGLGPLCEFEGLLSLHARERAMWGDMVVAVEDLQTVVFTLTKVGHSNMAVPQLTGSRGALTVHIPVSDSLYSKFTCKEHLSFTITAVFFNIGVNEKATLAEALGETLPQYHSNTDNLDRLCKYHHKYCKIFPKDPNTRASSRTKPLEEVMENLRISIHKKVPKNVEVLHLAALATRLMNGIRFTSCKSAKDRTGMAVTLEQVSILAAEYHLADHELQKALSIMRSEGCRRENTFKNIGIRKYAFTKKQVMALPPEYRPPPGTYGSSPT